MKKLLFLVTSFILGIVLIGCSSASKTEKKGIDVDKLDPSKPVTVKVGATNVPHAVLLEHVAPQLEKEGIKLDIVTYQDYYVPNKTLNDKEIDINYFQHVPFLKNAIKENIKLLASEGLVKVKDGVDPVTATFDDIAENPKKLQFSYENDPALMVKFYQNGEGDLVSINANFAVDAGLNAATEPVLVEKATDDNPYANIVVVREGDKDKLVVKKLVAALKSEDTQKFIKEKWNGAVLPVK